MNELKELEEWLVTAIKANEFSYEHAVKKNANKTACGCVCRILAYERVLNKIHTIQQTQKGDAI